MSAISCCEMDDLTDVVMNGSEKSSLLLIHSARLNCTREGMLRGRWLPVVIVTWRTMLEQVTIIVTSFDQSTVLPFASYAPVGGVLRTELSDFPIFNWVSYQSVEKL